jgi:hypothetical protein
MRHYWGDVVMRKNLFAALISQPSLVCWPKVRLGRRYRARLSQAEHRLITFKNLAAGCALLLTTEPAMAVANGPCVASRTVTTCVAYQLCPYQIYQPYNNSYELAFKPCVPEVCKTTATKTVCTKYGEPLPKYRHPTRTGGPVRGRPIYGKPIIYHKPIQTSPGAGRNPSGSDNTILERNGGGHGRR